MDKPHVEEAIIVEGRYDKNTVSQIVDALIIPVNGFGIFNNAEMRKWILSLAQDRGIIVLTDPDAAGSMIRKAIRGFVPNERIKDAYVPDIYGKEKRKTSPGKEGKLGVEGMSREVILSSLTAAGAVFSDFTGESCTETDASVPGNSRITNADLFSAGLSGRENSAALRAEFLRILCLPERLSTSDLLRVINRSMTREDFFSFAESIKKEDTEHEPSGIR